MMARLENFILKRVKEFSSLKMGKTALTIRSFLFSVSVEKMDLSSFPTLLNGAAIKRPVFRQFGP